MIFVAASVFILIEVSHQMLSSQEEKTLNPLILPMPIDSPNGDFDRQAMQSLQLAVKLSQDYNLTENLFNMTQRSSIELNVTLFSLSKNTEFTIPLYLSVGAFENQRSPQMITSPPAPYPALPWSSHKDSPDAVKPFEAYFNANPLTLEPGESKTAILTITALDDAPAGKYTMFLELGNWEQTGLAAVTFQMTVMPKR